MPKLTFIAWLGIDVKDIVVLSIWIFSWVSVVDVDVDSGSVVKALSCRTIWGICDGRPQEDLKNLKFWAVIFLFSSDPNLEGNKQNEVSDQHDAYAVGDDGLPITIFPTDFEWAPTSVL